MASSQDIDALFGVDEHEEEQKNAGQHAAAPAALPASLLSSLVSTDDVDELFGVSSSLDNTSAATDVSPPAAAPAHLVQKHRTHATAEDLTLDDAAGDRRRAPVPRSTAEAERLHAASLRAAARERAAALPAASSAAANSASYAVPSRPLLTDRDVLFLSPILSAPHPAAACTAASMKEEDRIFELAPESFSRRTAQPWPGEEDEDEKMLRRHVASQRSGGLIGPAASFDSGSSATAAAWSSLISMRGRSIASVSLSVAAREKVAHRAALEAESALAASKDTTPKDSNMHGPGVSDHSIHREGFDGYWELRTRKLAEQKADPDLYASLEAFQSGEQRTKVLQEAQEREARRERKRKRRGERREARNAEHTQPDDVPFSLGQSSPTRGGKDDSLPSSQAQSRANAANTYGASATLSQRSSAAVSGPPSPKRARGPIFAGVTAYINGDTETRHAVVEPSSASAGSSAASSSSSSSSFRSELSSLHLTHLVRLHGGQVMPYPSRSSLTHYVCDHLSLSKARAELRALSGGAKASVGAAGRHIHFVRPEWIRACMAAGRKVPEESFAVVVHPAQGSLRRAWGADAASASVAAGDREERTEEKRMDQTGV